MAGFFKSVIAFLNLFTFASALALRQKEQLGKSEWLASRDSALGSLSGISNLTEPVTWCFEPTPAKSFPVNLEMCDLALEAIIRRDGVDEFYNEQLFYQGPDAPPGAHITPDKWEVDLGVSQYCKIVLQSNEPGQTDRFRLLDVASAAQEVLNECIGPGKVNLGGASDVGKKLSFAVFVVGQKFPQELAPSMKKPSAVQPNDTGLAVVPTKTKDPSANKVPACFEPENSGVWPVIAETCELALELMIRRDGVEQFVKQQDFWYGPGIAPAYHIVPDAWPVDVGDNFCTVVLSGRSIAHDTFSLVDVAAKAQEIIDTCVRQGKYNLGGGVEVGTRGFFVAVNGRGPTSGVRNGTTFTISGIKPPAADVQTS